MQIRECFVKLKHISDHASKLLKGSYEFFSSKTENNDF